MTTAFFPGSFDPMTFGHLSILRQALAAFDEVVVGIGVHAAKTPMFSFEMRADLIRASLKVDGGSADIAIVSFDGLVVEAAANAQASVLVRGLRDGTDLNYEMQMAGMNGAMRPDITTVFLPASPETRPITATLVRQIAKMGGDVSPFVPEPVLAALRGKLA
ncbi:phosphopantetheine adenylyltransferase protein [Fulvimarina pelagi HTCC2506]|uniref:Phosphopantetheine adenylyltransferase n=2 Tax=Fulvimarina pelagi TaxID=217511 RepID=Q0G041_9HYPH|nr:pantetheine-phosphate adenylyltransferase [Fulvimarina pelagi]EAU40752.1 phosphopantetheine adenylyltransferase protein [Fulvimarina pelagi HTCC2506]BAT31293.1 phosphopantetheine adenylyltransferase protein [Fulvimarina pelagi]